MLLELPLIPAKAAQGQKEFPQLRYLLLPGGGRDCPNPREEDSFQAYCSRIPHLCCLDAWYLWMGEGTPHPMEICFIIPLHPNSAQVTQPRRLFYSQDLRLPSQHRHSRQF